MPKLKTHRGAKKRFKFTGAGDIKRSKANASHILTKKSRKRKRCLKQSAILVKEEFNRVRKLMPYG